MYSGTYMSQRYSALDQIAPRNVKTLEQKWVFQAESLQKFETTPLVMDGIMYLTQPPNDVVALDARTGRVFWIYQYKPAPDSKPCCGAVNRGLAILGDTLFMATIDARLIAIDARNGKPLWNTKVADHDAGYAMTLAPLVVKDKVMVGVAGGEYGIRGFLAAYDAATGKEAWRFYTIPGPGEPGHETWPADDSWQHGGGIRVAYRIVRPRTQPDLLGDRQSGSGLEPVAAQGRQSLFRFGGGAGRRHRQTEMAFSVHPARSLRLRLGAGSVAGGCAVGTEECAS